MGRRDTKPGDELLSAGLLWTVCSALLSAAAAALFTTRLEYTPRGHVTALSLPLCQKQTRSCLLKEKKRRKRKKCTIGAENCVIVTLLQLNPPVPLTKVSFGFKCSPPPLVYLLATCMIIYYSCYSCYYYYYY